MAQPPLHSFRVFESVARLGSLAAAERHVATGTVSQQVKALQASLGVELFEKRGRQLVLTAAMGEITEVVQALQAGVRLDEERVDICLSVPPAEGVEWLARPLLRFIGESRSVRVSVITAPGKPPVDWRRADVAVIYGTPPWPGMLSRRSRKRPRSITSSGFTSRETSNGARVR